MSYVYTLEHMPSGKIYVGKTNDLTRREREHRRNARDHKFSYHLHNTIRKHGFENFVFEVVEHLASEEEAYESEAYWIARLKEFGSELYNMTDGGEGQKRGWKPSDETRRRMSASKVGSKNSFFGREHSGSSKEKIGLARLGELGPNKGKKMSLESRERLRAARLGKPSPLFGLPSKPLSEARRAEISAFMKGKSKSEEHRAKIRQGNLGKSGSRKLTWANVEDIRACHQTGAVSMNELARRFDVSPSAISNIVRNLTWKKRSDV